jgi:hypothetical protein
MADDPAPDPVATSTAGIIDALADALRNATSPELMEAQVILLRRLALQGEVFPARIPAPRNITEVGGYLNLLERYAQPETRDQMLAATLGVAGPNPMPGWFPTSPVLFFAQRPNDRPPGPGQPAIPVSLEIRDDFSQAFDIALKTIHDQGCTLPVLSPVRVLPPAGVDIATVELLEPLGRTLDLVPSAALVSPGTTDPLALASQGTNPTEVVSLQLNPNAPNAGALSPAAWDEWVCTPTACAQTSTSTLRTYLQLTPILNAAGWYQPPPPAPVSLAAPGSWARWTNVTGLVAGHTSFGDELRLLWPADQIAASCVRTRIHWVWDGTQFAAP